ncbi:MAG: purine-nucleoside phosphorylase [Planctomycetota bacterium]|jgi:purine-nucleoside phosphorylase|nr:purine-nucleoside phosphorylase [Planctomycetota bacterium]
MILRDKIAEAVQYLDLDRPPEFAIVLGTGLGGLTDRMEVVKKFPYGDIPHFAPSTVISHSGDLVYGLLEKRPVIAMEGRLHYYEGYSMQDITFPIRVMSALGAKSLVVSNAAGGLDPQFQCGDIMLIDDHINMMGDNPLIGPNDESMGPRFPDMSQPYDKAFLELAEKVALSAGIRLHRGTYVALTGPCLETRAEYRYLRAAGAEAVGMSTVPEVIVGVHLGMRILGLSIITDICIPDALEPLTVEDVISAAKSTEPMMTEVVRRFVAAARL